MKSSLKAFALMCFTFAAGSFSAHAQSGAQPVHTYVSSHKAVVQDFSARLYKMAADKIAEEGYRMPYITRTSLHTYISNGVSKMYSAGLTTEKYTKMAEDNIMRFTSLMISDARSRGEAHMLDILSFRTAEGMCCPGGWPFC